jgi:hypothetical protein
MTPADTDEARTMAVGQPEHRPLVTDIDIHAGTASASVRCSGTVLRLPVTVTGRGGPGQPAEAARVALRAGAGGPLGHWHRRAVALSCLLQVVRPGAGLDT